MLPDTSEVSRWKEDFVRAALPDTGNVLTVSYTNSSGNLVESIGTATMGVACRLDPLAGKAYERLVANGLKPMNGYMLTVDASVTMTVANRFELSGKQYNVIAVMDGSWPGCGRYAVEAR